VSERKQTSVLVHANFFQFISALQQVSSVTVICRQAKMILDLKEKMEK
jgi:hypothetical protein